MKIRVKVGDLIEQVTQAAITVDRKANDMPSSKVYLQAAKLAPSTSGSAPALYLFSTDQASKTFIKLTIDSVEEDGKTLIDSAKLLGGLMNRDPKQMVELETLEDKSKTRMKIGKNVVNLPYEDAVGTAIANIKVLPKPSDVPIAKIAASTLIEFIRRSQFCIPTMDNGQQKFAMGVLHLKGGGGYYVAQATDGFIIAMHRAKQTDTTKYTLPTDLLIPYEALSPLSKILQNHKEEDVEIVAGKKDAKGDPQEVFFRMDKVLFGTVLKMGAYPDVQKLLDLHSPTFEIEIAKDEVKDALLRAANFVENNVDRRLVKLSTNGNLKVEAADSYSNLSDEIDIKLVRNTLSDVSVMVNIDYLINMSGIQISDRISLGFNTDKTKALSAKDISEAGMETRYAIMPVVAEAKKAKEPTKKTKAKPEVVEAKSE